MTFTVDMVLEYQVANCLRFLIRTELVLRHTQTVLRQNCPKLCPDRGGRGTARMGVRGGGLVDGGEWGGQGGRWRHRGLD